MTSLSAIGWIAVCTQRGQIMNGSRSVSERRISNETLPAPSTTAARSSTTATSPGREGGADLLPAGEMLGLRDRLRGRRGTRCARRRPRRRLSRSPRRAGGHARGSRRRRASGRGSTPRRNRRAAARSSASSATSTARASPPGSSPPWREERDHVVACRDQRGRERPPDEATSSRDRDAHPPSLSQYVRPLNRDSATRRRLRNGTLALQIAANCVEVAARCSE